ncbi:MAG TPA: hypothetical protein VFH43_02255 [Candidatus Kapabacteria bacterium]|nr:hypothetical protein [Candidatus Kapabacteria bacterium]
MSLLHPILLIAGLLCLISAPAQAQQRSTFGANFGYEFGAPLDIDRDPGASNYRSVEMSGTSKSHTGWIGLDYRVPEFYSDLHLRLGLSYGLAVGSFLSDDFADTTGIGELPSINGPITPTKQFEITNTSHLISPYIGLDLQPGDNWQLGFGIWSAINVRSITKRMERIINPLSYDNKLVVYRESQTRDVEIPLSASYSPSRFRFGPSVSTSWAISGGRNLTLRPELYAKMDIAQADLGLRAMSGGIRLNLVFGSNSRPAGDIIEEVAQDEPEMPKLTADVRITSNGVSLDEAITAEPRSVLHRRFETVLPFVEIPTVTDRARVERMIDLLGKRLVEVPASLTLAPTASDPTLPDAGRELANNITSNAEKYKASNGTQHAAPMTVNVAQPAKQRGITASGLVITADQPSVLRPLADQWIDSRYQLPPITIERFTDTRAGLKSWNVTVRQGRRMLARYSNLEGSTAELESGLILSTDQSSTIEPVLAEMSVTDLAGQVLTVFDTLRVRKGNADPDRADSIVYEFMLYSSPASHALADELTASNKVLLKTLKDQVPTAETIEIHYSPRSQRYASEIFNEISALLNDSERAPEIKLRPSRDVAAPAGINAVRVFLAQ